MSAAFNLQKFEKVFRFILDTGIVPISLFTRSLNTTNTSNQILQRNRNIVYVILMMGSIHKMMIELYKY